VYVICDTIELDASYPLSGSIEKTHSSSKRDSLLLSCG
jgi:hypothetical protein